MYMKYNNKPKLCFSQLWQIYLPCLLSFMFEANMKERWIFKRSLSTFPHNYFYLGACWMRNPLHVTVWFQLSVPSFTPEFEHYVLNMQSAFWSKHGHRAVNLHSVVTHALSCYDNKSWVILSFIRNKVLTGSCSLLCSVHVVKFTHKTRLMQSRFYKTPAKVSCLWTYI